MNMVVIGMPTADVFFLSALIVLEVATRITE